MTRTKWVAVAVITAAAGLLAAAIELAPHFTTAGRLVLLTILLLFWRGLVGTAVEW